MHFVVYYVIYMSIIVTFLFTDTIRLSNRDYYLALFVL